MFLSLHCNGSVSEGREGGLSLCWHSATLGRSSFRNAGEILELQGLSYRIECSHAHCKHVVPEFL